MLQPLLNFLKNTFVGGYSLLDILAIAVVFGGILYFLSKILCRTCRCIARTVRKSKQPPSDSPQDGQRNTVLATTDVTAPHHQQQLVPFTSDWANNDAIPTGSEKILVVDDEQLIRDVNKRILESLGYRVHCVSSGRAAIEYLQANDVDLMLLDLVMPEMDGVETFRAITSFKPHQKCVVLSAYPRYHKVVEIQSLGGGPYLVKPPGLAELAQTIRFELDRKTDAPTQQ